MTDMQAIAPWLPSDPAHWTYEQFVEAGQQVVSGGQWLLGDLACGLETKYGEGDLAKFASDISVEFSTLRKYKQVAQAYSESVRHRTISFGVHEVFATQSDRAELISSRDDWTVAQARELVANRRSALPGSPESSTFEATGQYPEIPELAPGLAGVTDDLTPEDFVDDLDDWGSGLDADKTADPDEAPSAEPKYQSPELWSDEEQELRKRLEEGETIVVSMHKETHQNLCKWADDKGLFVRIDRRTEWGNPFELPGDGDRGTVIYNFTQHYFPYKPSLHTKLGKLRGKALGCWCAPESCHGDVLKEQADHE